MDADSFAQIYLDAIRPYERTGMFHLVDTENSEATPVEGIRFMSTFGHTDGHCAIEMKSDDKRLVLTGDAWVSTVRNSIAVNAWIRRRAQKQQLTFGVHMACVGGSVAKPGMGILHGE